VFTVSKDFAFSASHVLDGLPDGHQCGRPHGHNYAVRIELGSETLDQTGFVLDYGDLRPVALMIDSTLDHRHLNDVFDFNPTAENMARYLCEWCERAGWPVTGVGVSETPKTWAWYRLSVTP
jgi:6-pyruvoyltetrahydropterin/6-carboxytetrahydropterin synthase